MPRLVSSLLSSSPRCIQFCLEPEELTCLRDIETEIDEEVCPEKCDGINADLTVSQGDSQGKLEQVFAQYEDFKCPNISSMVFPYGAGKLELLESCRADLYSFFSSDLTNSSYKFVRIFVDSSTFDKITKESITFSVQLTTTSLGR